MGGIWKPLTEKPGADEDSTVTDTILSVADELARQVDRTKKLVLVLIVAIIVSVPIIRVTGETHVDLGIGMAFLAVGVWQWVVLSRWTRRYRRYKALQRRIDRKLDLGDETPTKT
jgi:Flp pilus assembly protein TadB